MAYPISQRSLEGKTGNYARVKRKADGLWWDETSSAWVATAVSACNVALTETTAGIYTASAGLTPSPGQIYAIYVYDISDVLLYITEDTYTAPHGRTAISMVNAVQKELRLPVDTVITAAHAALILSFINKVTDLVPEDFIWDELKIKGAIATLANVSVYAVNIANSNEIDVIRHLQIANNAPLVHLSDGAFREYRRTNTVANEPVCYRIYARTGGVILVELAPTPDAAYQVDYEGLEKAGKLVNATDLPLLDPDILELGALYYARSEQGMDASSDLGSFNTKLSLSGGTQGESNLGDVQPV